MRAVLLSKPSIIDLLTRYFVPALLSIDDYGKERKSMAEYRAWQEVRANAERQKLFHGTVTAYVLDGDGSVIDSMDVGVALRPENLERMLEKVAKDRHLQPRKTDAISSSAASALPSPRPKHRTGLLLHVWTCYLPSSGDNRGVGEDWVELTSSEWNPLVPPPGARLGDSWDVPRRAADKLYRYFYPAVCVYNPNASRIHRADLTATLERVTGDEMTVGLQCYVDLDHNGDKEDAGRVVARLQGALRYDPRERLIKSFQMVSEKAVFGWDYHGTVHHPEIAIVVESVSRRPGS
jgi:hypothetical protein